MAEGEALELLYYLIDNIKYYLDATGCILVSILVEKFVCTSNPRVIVVGYEYKWHATSQPCVTRSPGDVCLQVAITCRQRG
jgi:hypothetical protein